MKKLVFLLASMVITFYAQSQTNVIDSMRKLIHSNGSTDSTTVAQLLKVANAFVPINVDSAISYSERSLQLSITLKYAPGIAESRALQGKAYLNKNEFAKAYESYLEALHRYTILNDDIGIATVFNGLGCTFKSQENYSKALQYFQQALSIYKKIDSKTGLANTYLNIGVVNAETNQYEKALEFYQRGLQFAESVGDKKIALTIYTKLGMLYASMEQLKKAIGALIRAKNLSLIAGDLPSVAEAYLYMGNTYRKLNQFDSSTISFNTSLSYFIQLQNKENISRTYSGIAALNFYQKNYDKAKEFAALSNEFAQKAKNNAILYDNYSLLIAISKAESDYKRVFEYYEKVLLLKESLFNAEKSSSIENIKATYELEKRQATIESLKEDNEVKTKQRNYLILLFSIVAMSLVLLAYSVAQIKRKTKLLQEQKKMLEDQKNELEDQKKELEDLHVVKDKFFSVLSHDLRAPMGNILGLLNLITQDGLVSEDEKKQLFNRLKLSTSSALETMDNMLAWGKNQIKENKIEIKEVNVFEVADRVCRFLNQSAENKSIKIINQINPSVKLSVDKNRLEFVIRNLISNALKFSHKNSTIELWTSADETFVNIHVKDFGTGMKRELQEKLFDVNKRESVNGTAGETGSGLGLALSKEFITQNNGDILVSSEPGMGTVFTIQHRWN